MRSTLLILCLLTGCFLARAAPRGLVFIENKGQWPADVRFRADLPGGFLFLKTNGLHYAFYDTRETARRHATAPSNEPVSPTIRAHGVLVTPVGSAGASQIVGSKPVETTFSYFSGDDPSRWAGGVRGFAEVRYHNLYPGVDLRIYAYYETLKYEFIVQPGVDPGQIRLTYDGADALDLSNNRLTVRTSVTEFRENAPYSFVTRGQHVTEVPTRWALDGQTARFVFPNGYDNTQALTIDPELLFVTFSGSRADNFGHAATYDADGNTYVAGSVWGTGFPTTRGAFQVSYAGQTDVGIMKFSADGSQLIYATQLGGSGTDLPHSIVVNSKGELIVMGSTASGDFPVTANAYKSRLISQAGIVANVYSGYLTYTLGSDLFLARLNAAGTSLIGSTFVGGSNHDGLNLYGLAGSVQNYSDEFRGEVIVGPADELYVASTTQSTDFPVTDGSTQKGITDGIVFRLSADLSTLDWATRLGGSQLDMAFGLRLAKSGALYVCGTTYSTGLGTSGALQTQLAGVNDGYVARLGSADGKLTAFTYLGTGSSDVASLIDIGPNEQPHVYGLSKGRYPVTAGVYSNAGSGQFIHALNADLSKTIFSTVFGSGRAGPDISPTAFLVNTCGNMYVAGWGGLVNTSRNFNPNSSTNGMPTTADAYKRTTNGSNFWLGIIEQGAKSFLYGTFMGDTTPADSVRDGDHIDGGTCRFDPYGTIYHAACSCRSNRFPASATAWSKTRGNANCNNIAFKFDTDRLQAGFDTYEGSRKNVVEGCTPLTLSLQNTSVGGKRYEWVINGKVVSNDPNRATYTFDKAGTYPVIIRAYNPLNCKLVDSTTRLIKVSPADFRVSKDTVLCAGKPVSLTAQGGLTYLWTTGSTSASAITTPTAASIVVVAQTSTTYSVSMTNEAGCSTNRTVTVRADNSFAPKIEVSGKSDCTTPTVLTFQNNTVGADRFVWSMGNGDTLRTRLPVTYQYPKSGQYEVVVTAYKQDCALTQRVPVTYENFGPLPNVVTANDDGKNDVFDTRLTGARLEIYNRWGRLLFATDNYQNNWGSKTPHGTYFYLLTTPGGSQCKGWIQVLE
ncbi:gliding motility-associated C-terminal domain-containing protein [Fibrella sp. WM1]|uniref:DUF7948 domain-containing protein n=1 Tax=Fibrella musci TaxID=3242485 RepID=UPI00352189BA